MSYLGIDIGGSSVKTARLQDGRAVWTAQSERYERPSAERLVAAIRQAVAGRAADATAVGLCVPGILDDRRERVMLSVNVPGLHDVALRDLASAAVGRAIENVTVANDSNAAGIDLYASRSLSGRLLALVIGTGVGAAVIDDGIPLAVDGDSPGHIGSIDVSLDENAPLGPDQGRGTLEGYLGVPALVRQYGADTNRVVEQLTIDDPPMRALVRVIRIAHAIYRPQHICLAGGIGIRLGRLLPALRDAVNRELTNVARAGWTLFAGEHDFHAAMGAARLAERRQRTV